MPNKEEVYQELLNIQDKFTEISDRIQELQADRDNLDPDAFLNELIKLKSENEALYKKLEEMAPVMKELEAEENGEA